MQGYDGPLQFLTSPNNPDQILPLSTPTTPINEDGEWNEEENIKERFLIVDVGAWLNGKASFGIRFLCMTVGYLIIVILGILGRTL